MCWEGIIPPFRWVHAVILPIGQCAHTRIAEQHCVCAESRESRNLPSSFSFDLWVSPHNFIVGAVSFPVPLFPPTHYFAREESLSRRGLSRTLLPLFSSFATFFHLFWRQYHCPLSITKEKISRLLFVGIDVDFFFFSSFCARIFWHLVFGHFVFPSFALYLLSHRLNFHPSDIFFSIPLSILLCHGQDTIRHWGGAE